MRLFLEACLHPASLTSVNPAQFTSFAIGLEVFLGLFNATWFLVVCIIYQGYLCYQRTIEKKRLPIQNRFLSKVACAKHWASASATEHLRPRLEHKAKGGVGVRHAQGVECSWSHKKKFTEGTTRLHSASYKWFIMERVGLKDLNQNYFVHTIGSYNY